MKKQLLIEGMSCMNCVRHVETALKELEELEDVTVNLDDKTAIISLKEEIGDDRLKEIIEDANYDLIEVKSL